MKNKKVLIIIILIILAILITFFIKTNYKFSKKGNNIINKSADELNEYILSIESYKATANIIVKSNKNENKYSIKQEYNKENNTFKQEVLEPQDIAGTQFVYDGTTLKVENTKLNLSKIYNNYKYIESHQLSLVSFIENYKQDEQAKCIEENGMVIFETNLIENNRYSQKERLYINKEKGKIERLEINDITQNTRIYILYNEIEINTTSKEEILAFHVKTFEEDI